MNDESIWKPIMDDGSAQSPLSPASADEYIEQSENKNLKSNIHLKSDEESNNANEDVEEPIFSRRKLFVVGGAAIVASIPLGLGAGYWYQKKSVNKKATTELGNLRQSYGAIEPLNTSTKTFKGQMLENVNIDQKALVGGTDNTADEAAVFIFSNGKNGAKRILDVYIDFDSQVSRDFVLINQSSLKNMVENGLIELRVHPVSSGTALSIYSPEALAESFVTSPAVSWDFMLSLLKLSAEIQANGDIEILPAIEEKIAANNVQDISAKSIQNGTFSSWIIAVGDDPKLKTGYYPPIVYVNDTIVDPEVVNFNNTDAMKRHILNFDVKE